MATYLVTGAAGMIGSKVVELLLDGGDKVVGVDDLCASYDVRLKRWRLEQLEKRPGFTFSRTDIGDYQEIQSVFESLTSLGRDKFAAVINLAARAGVRESVIDPWVFIRCNVTGTLNLLELCRRFEVRKFVLASTASVYGAHDPQPFRENANTDILLSPYAASKKAAEALCSAYHYLHSLDITVFRYFTVYGPAGRPDMAMFRFVKWIYEGHPMTIYGDGTQERDFTFLGDIARATIAGVKPLGYQVINLGTERSTKLNDLIALLERYLGRKAVIRYEPKDPADMMSTLADISKARELLGWEASTPLEEGAKSAADWYIHNYQWAKDIKI